MQDTSRNQPWKTKFSDLSGEELADWISEAYVRLHELMPQDDADACGVAGALGLAKPAIMAYGRMVAGKLLQADDLRVAEAQDGLLSGAVVTATLIGILRERRRLPGEMES